MTYQPEHLQRWTSPSNYFGAEWPEYYRAGFSRNRDSDDLTDSNFYTAINRLGGLSETILLVEESHWVVGYVQWIAIHESNEAALRIADDLRAQIEDYPALDDSDWTERESESASHVWKNCYNAKERFDYVRKHRGQFEFHDLRDMIGCMRGEYFSGYASELLN